MVDTLGLLAEAIQLARELGFDVREEPLGDTASGEVRIGSGRHILLNASDLPSDQLEQLARILAADERWKDVPVSKLLGRTLQSR
jgi:hypothetical protein